MHKTKPETPKLPPSPKSTVCRKPLLNITNLLQVPQHQQTLQQQQHQSMSLKPQKQALTRPESSKNIKPRISIDEFSRPKLKEVHSRRSNRSDSLDSQASQGQPLDRHCKNHKNRTAMHQIQFDSPEYFCFECSLVYAKQGYKIKPINPPCTHNNSSTSSSSNNTTNYQSQKQSRQKQTCQYLQKCSTLSTQLTSWRHQSTKAIKQIYQQYGQLINNHKIKMEEEMAKIRINYMEQIRELEQAREDKISKFREIDGDVEKIGAMLENTRIDIQRNYEDCIRAFNGKEFRSIMDEYWNRITQATAFLSTNTIQSLTKQPQKDIKMTVRTMQRSQNIGKDFTFSKQKKFETPPFSKELRGIKIVESQPDSNRYESATSMRESVVDSKINFSQFQI